LEDLLSELDRLCSDAEDLHTAADYATRPALAEDSVTSAHKESNFVNLHKLPRRFNQLIKETIKTVDDIDDALNRWSSIESNARVIAKVGPLFHLIAISVRDYPQHFKWTVDLSGSLIDILRSLGLYGDERRSEAAKEIILPKTRADNSRSAADISYFDLYTSLLEAFGGCLDVGEYTSALAIRAFFPSDNQRLPNNHKSRVDRIISNQAKIILEGLDSALIKLAGDLDSRPFIARSRAGHPLTKATVKSKLLAIESSIKLLSPKKEQVFNIFNGAARFTTALLDLDRRHAINREGSYTLACDQFMGVSTAISVLKQLGNPELSTLILGIALKDSSLISVVQAFMLSCNTNLELAQNGQISRSKVAKVVADSFLADWLSRSVSLEDSSYLPNSGIRYLKPHIMVGSNIGTLCRNIESLTCNLESLDLRHLPFIEALCDARGHEASESSIIKRVVDAAEAGNRSIFGIIRDITKDVFTSESRKEVKGRKRLETSLQLLLSGFLTASAGVDILLMAKELKTALEQEWSKDFFERVSSGARDILISDLDSFLMGPFTSESEIREARISLVRRDRFFSTVGVQVFSRIP
jgi:hypothetical protein